MKNNKKIIVISLLLLTIAVAIGILAINRSKKEIHTPTQPTITASSEKPQETPKPIEKPVEKQDALPVKEAPAVKPTQKPAEPSKDKPTNTENPPIKDETKPTSPPIVEKPQEPIPEKPTPPVVEHYHGNGSDSGTCPACGLGYSPNVDISGGDGATDIGGTWG